MGVEPPGRQGARRENTRLYLGRSRPSWAPRHTPILAATDEQRSRAGWIGAQTAQVILARALRVFYLPMEWPQPSDREACHG